MSFTVQPIQYNFADARPLGSISVRDGTFGRDEFQLNLDNNIVIGGINLEFYSTLVIALHDLDATVFDSDALPAALPLLSEFESPRINATATTQSIAQNQSDDDLRIGITSLTLIPLVSVPEPSTLSLFATGLAGLGFMGWRRKRVQLKAA